MDFEPDAIPEQQRELAQWICWLYKERDGKPTKVPADPHTGKPGADPTDPDEWADFETAVATAEEQGIGIGFCFNADGLIAGIDLDDCVDEDGNIAEWAQKIIDTVDSYTIISTSGTGVHIYVLGFVPGERNRRGDVEIYGKERFFAHTGDHLEGTPETIDQRQEALAEVHAEWVAEDEDEDQQTLADVDAEPADLSVEELLAKAKNAKNGDKFERLWNGDTSDYASGDNDGFSEGVLALLNMLAFWTAGDAARMEALFKRSGLYPHPTKPGKFDRLLSDEIEKARGYVSDYYEPPDEEPLEGVEEVDDPDPSPPEEWLEEALAPDGSASESAGGSSRGLSSWARIRSQYRRAKEHGVETEKIKSDARYVATRRLEEAEADFATNEVSDHLYVYDPDEGIYLERGEPYVQERLVDELHEQFARSERNEIVAQIKGRTFHHPDEFGGPPGHICVGNGILVVDRDGVQDLIGHTPNHLFMSKVQADYDPEADCPRFLDFIESVVTREGDRLTLQEFVGYCLLNWGVPYHKALFIAGPQASGKSTFLDVVRELLGTGAVTSMAPQELVDNRFTAIKLWKAWANVRNDISAELLQNIGKFKEIVAGDEIYVEDKNEKGFFIQPRAKHLYSANQLPDIQTDDDAFFRRIVLVAFPHTVPRPERDEHLLDALLEELPGILNWAIDGLERLMDQGRFTGDQLPGAVRETWEAWGDSISRFKSECLVKEPDAIVAKKDAYQAYSAFCDEQNLPVMTQQKLTRDLKRDAQIGDAKRTPDGYDKKVRCYTGVRLHTDWEPERRDDDGGDPGHQDSGLDSF